MGKLRVSLAALMLVCVYASLPVLGETTDMRRPKKLIETGWDKPDTEALRQNLEAMEKRPFDARWQWRRRLRGRSRNRTP